MGFAYEWFGLDSFRWYTGSLLRTPKITMLRAFRRRTLEEEEELKASEGNMELKRTLGAFDLISFGVGMMLGAGVFVTTGDVAAKLAGPAVIIAYLVAGFSAMLSCFCYAEFAVNTPLAGGGFSYVMSTLGEYIAWITVTNLILEYVLANAAVARGFSPYLASLFNLNDDLYFVITSGGFFIDFWAAGVILLLTVLLTVGVKESAMFSNVMNVVHLLLIVFIIVAGFTQADPNNAKPFLPFSWRGIFDGASIVFFAFVGFDAVATTAEETINPGRNMPIGILGSLSIVTVCYILMSAVLVTMVPLSALSIGSSFSSAFDTVGLNWAKYIVALGALVGILTSTFVGMLGVARIICSVGRLHLLPPVLARVHPRFQTPWIATILQGVVTALIALVTDFAELIEMVSIGTLFIFFVVAVALVWKRSYVPEQTRRWQVISVVVHLVVLIAASLGFVCTYRLTEETTGLIVSAAIAAATIISMCFFCKSVYVPPTFGVPLYPILPGVSIFLNVFLTGTLGKKAYERFGYFTIAVTGIYILYSVHAATSLDAATRAHADGIEGGGKAIPHDDLDTLETSKAVA